MTEMQDIAAFRQRFNMDNHAAPIADVDVLIERTIYLQEEFDELQAAITERDLVEVADALVDMVYIIKGTVAAIGISEATWDGLWREVHASNMSKQLATSADMSKRGLVGDVFKPEGWTGPDIAGVLQFQTSGGHHSILAEALDIMDKRGQEALRQYGPMQDGMDKAADVASVLAGHPLTGDDVLCALIGLKLSREHYNHKRDNLLDAVAYMSALNERRDKHGV